MIILQDGRWSWQADRDSSLFGCRSNEYTAELMETPTSFIPSKFFIVTSDFEENCYIVKKRTKTVPREVISRCWEVKSVLGAYIKAMKYMYNRAKIRVRKVGHMSLKVNFQAFIGYLVKGRRYLTDVPGDKKK
ncbi:hypothetical protein H5410_019964 [Solanum commersonii]|uniref:Uncharacterized protein n=1 Tax=Solanum commersonii TaxID=4109 RepID=A0A9J5Z6Q3_SOLCO|nr:hypothetical protein H5410_019964 [Solanum commersonii]